MKTPHCVWVATGETKTDTLDALRFKWLEKGARIEPDLFDGNRGSSTPYDYQISEVGSDFSITFDTIKPGVEFYLIN